MSEVLLQCFGLCFHESIDMSPLATQVCTILFRREFKRQGKTKVPPKSREWIEMKKERRSKQGKR